MDYQLKTKPFDHQLKVFELQKLKRIFAILADMGTGKTKIALDTAAYQYTRGFINCVIVIAPNGVHRNWLSRELPAHMPDYIDVLSAYWKSTPLKKEREALEALVTTQGEYLRIFTINYESLVTKKKRALIYIKKLMTYFKCMIILDESHRIKTPGAKRTKVIQTLSRHPNVVSKRILTGTAILQGPLDAYSQFKFLDPEIFGHQTFTSFKNYYAKWEKRVLRNKTWTSGKNKGKPMTFNQLVSFQNIDELAERMSKYSFRIRKEDCLDLPDKIFIQRPVILDPNQRRMYDQMLETSIASIDPQHALHYDGPEDLLIALITGQEKDNTVSASMAMTRILRLQQIIGGYPKNEAGNFVEISTTRLKELRELIDDIGNESLIIWSRFRPELEAIEQTLREKFGVDQVVSYHGGVKSEDRERSIDRFKSKQARFFVANPQSAATGLTLTAASYVCYYSNSFNLEHRLQSEDRAHRIGQKNNVTYIDIIAEDTIDSKIADVLTAKGRMASEIMDKIQGL